MFKELFYDELPTLHVYKTRNTFEKDNYEV